MQSDADTALDLGLPAAFDAPPAFDRPSGPPAFMPALHVEAPRRHHDASSDPAFRQPAPLNVLESSYALAYRIAHCLTGLPDVAERLASEAVRSVFGTDQPPADPIAPIAMASVDLVLAHHGSLIESGRMNPAAVSHLLHRTRLVRELRRWDRNARAALALRHIDHRSPGQVARHLGIGEQEVRDVTGTWWPADGSDGSEAMLHGIDAWIGGPLKTPVAPPTGPLEVLDDPIASSKRLNSLHDLPGAPLTAPAPPTTVEPGREGGRLRRRGTR